MALSTKILQFTVQYEVFKGLPFDAFFKAPGSYTEWDGLSLVDFEKVLLQTRSMIDSALEKKVFDSLPVVAVTGLINAVAAAAQQCQTLIANPGHQGMFQGAAGALDAFAQQLALHGVPFLVSGGADADKAKAFYEAEVTRLGELRITADALNRSITNLVEPAVANSLSKSFHDRCKSLYRGRLFWLAMVCGTLVAGIVFTREFVEGVLAAFTIPSGVPAGATKVNDAWPVFLLRSIVLIPVYIGFGFSFSQYRKERDLEEEYAHKAAVAATLPNYGDLARNDSVKDQIVSGATSVIFSSPISKTQEHEKDVMPTEGVKNIIESVIKLVGRR